MSYSSVNHRRVPRTLSHLPIQLSFGSQIIVQGQLKDISLKSAFVCMKGNIYMQPHDEVSFAIQRSLDSAEALVEGWARISRIADGEGIAIYFTQMDNDSLSRLKELVG